jgi:Na+/proline symporter
MLLYVQARANKENPILISYALPKQSQTAYSIATSIFISGMGAWILATLPETGVLGGYLGIFGYALSVWLPFVLVAYIGVKVKEALGNRCTSFTFVSFLQK